MICMEGVLNILLCEDSIHHRLESELASLTFPAVTFLNRIDAGRKVPQESDGDLAGASSSQGHTWV